MGFGAVLVAEGKPVRVGAGTVIRENALIRATAAQPVLVGEHVLVGPHAALMGCVVEDECFLATGVAVFHGARVGRGSEVRIHGVVHVKTVLPPGSLVPIGWVAVGDPAQILPPDKHDDIWAVQKALDFPRTAYGLERDADGRVDMKELTRLLAEAAARHRDDAPP